MRKISMRKPSYVLAVGAGLMMLVGCTSPSSPLSTSPSPVMSDGGTTVESPTASPEPTTTPVKGQCASEELVPSIQGMAEDTGTTTIVIGLTNTSTTASCTLQGWPGVSFVQGGNGTQLGAAAEQDLDSTHDTVTLNADGGAATFTVTLFPYSEEECDPTPADGIRIYPPGETQALFVDGAEQNFVGCASETASVLLTSALQPMAAAP